MVSCRVSIPGSHFDSRLWLCKIVGDIELGSQSIFYITIKLDHIRALELSVQYLIRIVSCPCFSA